MLIFRQAIQGWYMDLLLGKMLVFLMCINKIAPWPFAHFFQKKKDAAICVLLKYIEDIDTAESHKTPALVQCSYWVMAYIRDQVTADLLKAPALALVFLLRLHDNCKWWHIYWRSSVSRSHQSSSTSFHILIEDPKQLKQVIYSGIKWQ